MFNLLVKYQPWVNGLYGTASRMISLPLVRDGDLNEVAGAADAARAMLPTSWASTAS
jgi:hypothetical protein